MTLFALTPEMVGSIVANVQQRTSTISLVHGYISTSRLGHIKIGFVSNTKAYWLSDNWRCGFESVQGPFLFFLAHHSGSRARARAEFISLKFTGIY